MVAPPSQVLGQVLARRRPPACPELELWLVAGHVDLNAHCEALMHGGRAPYWAFCWGAGQALARYVLDHPERVRGRHVVDLGAGSGVVGIASALAGASRVSAVDVDADARRIIALNAALNGVEVGVAPRPPAAFDVLLAADVAYDATSAPPIACHVAAGRRVLCSEPERRGAGRPDAPALARIEAPTFPDVDAPTRFNVVFEVTAIAGSGR